MRNLLLIGVSLAVLIPPATAAEQPVPVYKRPRPALVAAPIYTWTGFYIGGVAGGSPGKFDVNNSVVGGDPAATTINAVGAQSVTRANAALGLQAGYNWQFGRFVAGIETDIEFIGLSGGAITNSIRPGPTPFTWTSNTSANWLMTVRPRLGFALNNWLLYGTGGVAVSTVNALWGFNDTVSATAGYVEGATLSTTRVGYAVGGGAEVGLWEQWSLKAEYLYVNFGTVNVTSNSFVPAVPTTLEPAPFVHSVDLKSSLVRLGLNYRFAESAADLRVRSPVFKAPPSLSGWTGWYIGAHTGAMWGVMTPSNPFGTSMFGEDIRTPGALGGGQIGYNWQAPGSMWVYGIEADASVLGSDGTITCFALNGTTINETCRARPQFTGSFTGRFGATVDREGRTLLYGKGGLAWINDRFDMALNNGSTEFGPPITSNSANLFLWGWTLGIGVERALTPAWSLRLEYDYMGFERGMIANLGSSMWNSAGINLSATPPSTSSISQNAQTAKLALNYKLGANPWTNPWEGPAIDPVKGPLLAFVPGWGFEFGGRYVGSWNQFQKNFGLFTATGVTPLTAISRLTYDDMQNNAGEFFGRIDTPWKLFVKGYVGGGRLKNGHMADEDFGIPLEGAPFAPYSNTVQSVVTGDTFYGVIDGGFDFLLGRTYKVGVFAGYFHFDEKMNAFGCTPIANINCIENTPTSGLPGITETDHWDTLRIGAAGEMMLTPRVKLSADVAYLPWVKFDGVDDHFVGNTGLLDKIFPEWGHQGQGVMIDVIASYYFTPQFSIGVGGRYWGLWTTSAAVNSINVPVPTPPQFFKANVEQAGAFVQMSYKLGN